MARVLIVSTDLVGTAMAGPGIRSWEIARVLSAQHQVHLAAPGQIDRRGAGFALVPYMLGEAGALAEQLAWADLVIGQGFVFELHPELLACPQPLAIDLYDPLVIEGFDLYATADLPQARAQHARYQSLTLSQLRRGDFFFCATPIQRDYWLGALMASERLTPEVVRSTDRDLRRLVDVVPSGIASEPATASRPVLRGVHPAIGPDDIVLLWAGGIWEWFDPLVLIRAVAHIQHEAPHVRLCFFGGARPNPHGAPFRTQIHEHARALAVELELHDRTVIFLDEWVAYDERGAYLAEADVGVSAHRAGIETRLAFRTRLLDYLWARLPVICSAGDYLGEEIARSGAGLLVPPDDVSGWTAALKRMCHDPALRSTCRAAADRLAASYTWDAVLQPLMDFCVDPRRSASRVAVGSI